MELDVSDAFGEEMLSDFCVIRREETLVKGRSTVKDVPLGARSGVVCAASSDDLKRLPDGQWMENHISVVTQFQLRGPSETVDEKNFQPDLIEWRGAYYVVKTLDPYPHAGPGFCQAICGQTTYIAAPPCAE